MEADGLLRVAISAEEVGGVAAGGVAGEDVGEKAKLFFLFFGVVWLFGLGFVSWCFHVAIFWVFSSFPFLVCVCVCQLVCLRLVS